MAAKKKAPPKLPKYLYAPARADRSLIYMLEEDVRGGDLPSVPVVPSSPSAADAKHIAGCALGSKTVVRYVLESSIRPGGKS